MGIKLLLDMGKKKKTMCSVCGLTGEGDICTTYLISLARTYLSQGYVRGKVTVWTVADHSLIPMLT